MIFQRFSRNKLKRKRQHCSKIIVTVAKPPSKTVWDNLTGFEKFRE
jgi:hypothetical protein